MSGREISKSFCRICGSGVPWSSGDGPKMIVSACLLREEPKIIERLRIFATERPFWSKNYEQINAHDAFPE